jgi:predicted transcriptional regulator
VANQFLVEIHAYISRQIEAGLKERSDAQSGHDAQRAAFMDGRVDELKTMRRFLSDHFDLTTQKYY